MPSWRKTASWLLGFSAFALGSGLLVFGGSRQDVSAAPFAPIRLQGSGDDDIARELPVWNARLSTATRPPALNYFTQGSSSGRSQLLSGSVDFAVSGVPFTAAELAARPAGAAEIIEVPISVGSAAVVLTTPAGSGWSTFSPAPNCDPDDPDADPTTCAPIIGPFNGPWRIPANNLSAMITGLAPGFRGNGLTNWSHPDLVAAFGRSDLIVQAVASRHHTFVLRADITAQNQYLLEYARDLGPVAWGLAVESTPQFDWTAIGERLPSTVVTRFGVETQMGVIALANIDAATNATPDSWTGNGGPIPTTQVAALQASSPGAGLVVAEIQNARGEYVAPNRASLDAALVDPSQPSAYPLTYINRLFTVAGTLTPDEANALAASVRYIVTDGQDTMVEHGSTTLTTQLRDEALAKADQIVAANCTAEGYEVTAGGPSEFEPDSPLLGAIASMLHCTPRAGTPTTLPPLQRPRITGALSSFPARFISQWRFEVARPPYEIAVDSVTAGADLARSQYITGAADFATTETPFRANSLATAAPLA